MNPNSHSPSMDFPQYYQKPMPMNNGYGSQQNNPNFNNFKKQQNPYIMQNFPKKPIKTYQDFYKTQMCPMMPLGNCYKGDNCTYAHSEQELRKKPDLSKTKLCEAFMKGGSCLNSDRCSFAHGASDLKSTPDFYKTALCYSFKNSGICQAGDRCRYAHGENELKPTIGGTKAKSGKMMNYPNYNMEKGQEMMNQQNMMEDFFPMMQNMNMYNPSPMMMSPNPYMNQNINDLNEGNELLGIPFNQNNHYNKQSNMMMKEMYNPYEGMNFEKK